MEKIPYIPNIHHSSTKKKDYQFTIKPIPRDSKDIEKIATFITEIYVTQEPIHLTLEFTFEELFPYVKFVTEHSIKNYLGVIAYEYNSNEIAGVVILEDLNNIKKESETEVFKRVGKFNEKYEKINVSIKPILERIAKYYSHNDCCHKKINVKFCCTANKYQNIGLMQRMLKFVVIEHPLFLEAEGFVTTATSITGQTAFTKNGFRTLVAEDYDIMEIEINNKEEKPFELMEEKLTNKNLQSTSELKVMYFEKQIRLIDDIMNQGDMVNEMEYNQSVIVYKKPDLTEEHQKTKYGEAIYVRDIKKRDIVDIFEHPVIIYEIMAKKEKGVWLTGKNVLNYTDVDVVFQPDELIEKLDYSLDKYKLYGIVGSYAKLKREVNGEEENIKLQMPSSSKEISLFDKIKEIFKNKKEVEIEVLNIKGEKKIVNCN